MSNQPFYHLRPNKNIDRNLFLQSLIGLNRIFPISTYKYTGFGSFLFDDFRLIHDALNITKMVSLEYDHTMWERAIFNVPYKCIDIENISSSDYIANLTIDDTEQNIFWLDFVEPKCLGQQLNDFAALLELLNPHDVIRITINATPSSLGKMGSGDEIQQNRMDELARRINASYIPSDLAPDNMTTVNYPRTLLKVLKKVACSSLIDTPPYSPNFLFPLFASVYADGQQMLTLTGVVLDDHEDEALIRNALECCDFANFSWDSPVIVEIPALSIREITELNKRIPDPMVRQLLINEFPFIFSESDPNAINSYISYYKYYPNYYKVSF